MQNYDKNNKCLVKSQYTTTIVGSNTFGSRIVSILSKFSREILIHFIIFKTASLEKSCNQISYILDKEFNPVES